MYHWRQIEWENIKYYLFILSKAIAYLKENLEARGFSVLLM